MVPKRLVYTTSSRPVPSFVTYFELEVSAQRLIMEFFHLKKKKKLNMHKFHFHCMVVLKGRKFLAKDGWRSQYHKSCMYTQASDAQRYTSPPQCSQEFGCSDDRNKRHPGLDWCQGSWRVFSAPLHRDIFRKISLVLSICVCVCVCNLVVSCEAEPGRMNQNWNNELDREVTVEI